MPDLSICIVNWNETEYLRGCLQSIYQQPWQVSYEVIIVDNASADDSLSMVRDEFPQAQLHVNDENLGFARGNNQAFALATGRYLLLLNNDTLILPGALDHLVRFLDHHPEAGMAGCQVLNPDRSLQPSCRRRPTLGSMVSRALYVDKLLPNSRWSLTGYSGWDHDSVREVDEVKGCCLLVRREVTEQIGGLDERFFMFWEESDWCYRARQAGWHILFTPGTQVIHYGGQATSLQSARMSVIYYQSLLKLFDKYYGPAGSIFVRVTSFLGISARMGYWSFASLLRPVLRDKYTQKIGVYRPAWRWLLTGAQ